MNVQELYIELGKKPFEVIGGGREWHGPCPACGGDKRFVIWRQRRNEGGDYWCRDCGAGGDNIQFMVDFIGMEYREAFERAGRPNNSQSSTRLAYSSSDYRGRDINKTASLWIEKAGKFVEYAHEQLLKNSEALAYLAGRGINRDSVVKHRLGYNPGKSGKYHLRPRDSWGLPPREDGKGKPKKWLWFPEGIVVPNFCSSQVWSIQIRQPDGFDFGPRYVWLEGGSNASFVLGHDRHAFVVVEARLCAIAVYQAASDLVGVFAAQTVGGHPDTKTHKLFTNALQILNTLDYEDLQDVVKDGHKAGLRAVKRWNKTYPHCDRWPVPNAKDPGDAVKKGLDLRKWVIDGLAPVVLVRNRIEKQKECAPKPQEVAMQNDTAFYPGEVMELKKLMDSSPVRIRKSDDEVKLFYSPRDWWCKYPDISQKISALVFTSQSVIDHIYRHPHKMLSGSNFLVQKETPCQESNLARGTQSV